MTREEKAKAYDEALERAKEMYNINIVDTPHKGIVEYIFPELAESEDERIRKHIIDIIKDNAKSKCIPCDAEIAYLEKQKINTEGDFGRGYNCGYEACLNSHGAEWFENQKEQKPIFKEGDRVIWDGEEFNILDVYKDTYNVGGYIVPFSREGELHPIGQKPAEWSEEEKERIRQNGRLDVCYNPEKYGLCNKTEWSEEDEEELQNAIDCLEYLGNGGVYASESGYDAAKNAAKWLRSLYP